MKVLEALERGRDSREIYDLINRNFQPEVVVDLDTERVIVESILYCIPRLNDKEWIVLLSTILFDRSKLIPEYLLLQTLAALEQVREKHQRMVAIALGHIAVGQKNQVILNRILQNLKQMIAEGSSLSTVLKSLVFLINESPKIANEVILALMPFLHEQIAKSPLARTRSIVLDSDSELSDADPKKRQRPEWKLQQHALLCVESLARVCFLNLAITKTNAFSMAKVFTTN
jgi:hypothetical protein